MQTPVLSLLLREINVTNKKGSSYDIAKALMQHYHEIPSLTIHELADTCLYHQLHYQDLSECLALIIIQNLEMHAKKKLE